MPRNFAIKMDPSPPEMLPDQLIYVVKVLISHWLMLVAVVDRASYGKSMVEMILLRGIPETSLGNMVLPVSKIFLHNVSLRVKHSKIPDKKPLTTF